jgi:hypothetical protein
MTNVEFQLVLHALDTARARFGLNLINPDDAAERIRFLINMTVKACESASFGGAIALVTTVPFGPSKPEPRP